MKTIKNYYLKLNLKENIIETNVNNKYQGKFRKTILDLDLLKYAINKDEYLKENKNLNLCITCLEHIEGNFKYTFKNELFEVEKEDFIKNISKILNSKNTIRFENHEAI